MDAEAENAEFTVKDGDDGCPLWSRDQLEWRRLQFVLLTMLFKLFQNPRGPTP